MQHLSTYLSRHASEGGTIQRLRFDSNPNRYDNGRIRGQQTSLRLLL